MIKTKVGSFDTIYSELYHYFPVDEQQVPNTDEVPNTAALYRNEGSRKQPLLPQEYVWWDLMSVMVHATSLYGPTDEPENMSLSFLKEDHPAIALIWTDRSELKKIFQTDKTLFVQQLKKGRATPFNDQMKMSRFWNEYDM